MYKVFNELSKRGVFLPSALKEQYTPKKTICQVILTNFLTILILLEPF